MSDENDSTGPIIEKVATIAIVIVVVAVVLGFLRLAIAHWGYILLAVLAAAGGFYIYSQSKTGS